MVPVRPRFGRASTPYWRGKTSIHAISACGWQDRPGIGRPAPLRGQGRYRASAASQESSPTPALRATPPKRGISNSIDQDHVNTSTITERWCQYVQERDVEDLEKTPVTPVARGPVLTSSGQFCRIRAGQRYQEQVGKL